MIITSKIKLSYNPDAINKDFSLIKIQLNQVDNTGKPKYIGYVDFYEALEQEKGIAAINGNGKYWYMLVDKKITSAQKVIERLQESEGFKDFIFFEGAVVSEPEDKNSMNQSSTHYYGYGVIQLLLDLLGYRHMSIESMQFSNIASNLFFIPKIDKSRHFIDAWLITLTKSYAVKIRKTRFIKTQVNKRKSEKKEHLFIINAATKTLKSISSRHAQETKNIDIYSWSNPFNTRATANFIDLADPLLEDTRIGVWSELYRLIQEKLSPYCDISFDSLGAWSLLSELKVPDYSLPTDLKRNPYIKKAVENIQEVAITSDPKDSEGEKQIEEMLQSVHLKINKEAQMYVNLIPNKENLSPDEPDPYKKNLRCQHITIQTLSGEQNEAIIARNIYELAIKKDCLLNKASFGFELSIRKPYRVGLFKQKNKEERANRNEPELESVHVLDIGTDGKLRYTKIENTGFAGYNDDLYFYHNVFKDVMDKRILSLAGAAPYQLEGFIEVENAQKEKEITIIAVTDYITLPDPDAWYDNARGLKRALPDSWNTIEKIKKQLEDAGFNRENRALQFFSLSPSEMLTVIKEKQNKKDVSDKLKNWIQQFENNQHALLNKDVLRQLLNLVFGKTSDVRLSIVKLLEQEGVLFNIPRTKESKHNDLAAKIGLRICPADLGLYKALYYFTGFPVDAQIKPVIVHASVIRVAIAIGDHEPFFPELADTFAPWIRVDEGTVLPGAFKYLREYIEAQGRS